MLLLVVSFLSVELGSTHGLISELQTEAQM